MPTLLTLIFWSLPIVQGPERFGGKQCSEGFRALDWQKSSVPPLAEEAKERSETVSDINMSPISGPTRDAMTFSSLPMPEDTEVTDQWCEWATAMFHAGGHVLRFVQILNEYGFVYG